MLCVISLLTNITVTQICSALCNIIRPYEHLDERLLLLACEAAETIEALALAIAIVKATVRALGKFGNVADVRDAVAGSSWHGARHTLHNIDEHTAVGAVRAGHTIGHRERATDRAGAGTLVRSGHHFQEVLHAGLARLVCKRDQEIHAVVRGCVHHRTSATDEVGEWAEVGA